MEHDGRERSLDHIVVDDRRGNLGHVKHNHNNIVDIHLLILPLNGRHALSIDSQIQQ